MNAQRAAWLVTVIVSGVIGACGGGGGDDAAPAPVADAPPTNGSYAGTYKCANTSYNDAQFTAVLATPTGTFSSCSGGVFSNTLLFTCTGSITGNGKFTVSGGDNFGTTFTYDGTAGATKVVGTGVVNGRDNMTFACTH